MKENYVLIDYENVQPETLEPLNCEHFHVLVFIGDKQSKVSYEVASALQRMGNKADYIKIAGNGKNALDFHIAFYIGQLAAQDRDAYFHVVSKDTGFDPLIGHMKEKNIHACRVSAVSEIPLFKEAKPKSSPNRISMVVANLVHRGASKPRTLKTLSTTINAIFQKSLSGAEVTHIIDELKNKGFLTVNQSKVTYPTADPN